jgi:hypothetical protein
MATRAEVATCLERIELALMRSMPAGSIEVYAQELSDVPAELLAAATSRSIRTLKFFPTIAELLEFAEEAKPKPPSPLLLRPAFLDEPKPDPDCEEAKAGRAACAAFVAALRQSMDMERQASNQRIEQKLAFAKRKIAEAQNRTGKRRKGGNP